MQWAFGFAPSGGDDFGDLPIGHVGQSDEDILQVSIRVEVAPPAAFDDGLNDGTMFPCIRIPDKEPVFLADGDGADGVFHQVVVDLHPAVGQINVQGAPETQRIIVTNLIGVIFFAELGSNDLRRFVGLSSTFAAKLPRYIHSDVIWLAFFIFQVCAGTLPHWHHKGWVFHFSQVLTELAS